MVSVTVKLVAVGKEVPSVTKTVLATRVPDNCLTQPDQLSSSCSFSSHYTSSLTAASLIRSFLSRLDQNPSETNIDNCLVPIRSITSSQHALLSCNICILYLRDNSSEFFLSCSDSDSACDFTQVPVGVLTEDTPPLINSIAIILEGNIVMDEIPTTSQALCLLFGLMYAPHLDYPKGERAHDYTLGLKYCDADRRVK